MAVRDDFTAGEVLAAADLNDTFASKLNLAGGKILQVVRATDTTSRSTNSTSLTDVTGMSVTITPQKSTSAVIIIASHKVTITSTSDNVLANFAITDNSNNAISGSEFNSNGTQLYNTSTGRTWRDHLTHIAYATPGTTSAVTFKLRFNVSFNTATISIENNLSTGQMYAIEVSA
jgi:hypothetical protein